jgi:hypothetical protein
MSFYKFVGSPSHHPPVMLTHNPSREEKWAKQKCAKPGVVGGVAHFGVLGVVVTGGAGACM